MSLKKLLFLCSRYIAQQVLMIFVFSVIGIGRKTQHGNAGVCAPPAKRT